MALHWSCATQKVVVLSTAEAELRALTDATRSVLGFQGLAQRLMDCADGDERCHPLVYCDAQAALDAVQNGYSAKMRYSKTLQVNLAWLRDRSESGEVTFLKISSLKNLADLFTKPLPAERFQELRAAIGLQPYPPSSVPSVAAAPPAEAEDNRPAVQSADLFGDAAAARSDAAPVDPPPLRPARDSALGVESRANNLGDGSSSGELPRDLREGFTTEEAAREWLAARRRSLHEKLQGLQESLWTCDDLERDLNQRGLESMLLRGFGPERAPSRQGRADSAGRRRGRHEHRERSPRGRGRDERSGRDDRDMRNTRDAREPAPRASPAPPARAVVREDDGFADGVHSSKWRARRRPRGPSRAVWRPVRACRGRLDVRRRRGLAAAQVDGGASSTNRHEERRS